MEGDPGYQWMLLSSPAALRTTENKQLEKWLFHSLPSVPMETHFMQVPIQSHSVHTS